jgi:hypothetical protein
MGKNKQSLLDGKKYTVSFDFEWERRSTYFEFLEIRVFRAHTYFEFLEI